MERSLMEQSGATEEQIRNAIDQGAITKQYFAQPEHVVSSLNRLRSTEITSYLQYKQHGYMAVSLLSPGLKAEFEGHATQELAQQILALHALNDYAIGTTVNVGVVHAGTRPNVVAAEAEAHVDVRVETLAEAARIDAAIRGLQPKLPGAQLAIDGGLNRPPMERSAAMAELFGHAQKIAAGMRVDLAEGSTGGGSDGNFTAAMGVPTLDGLGPEGEGAHAAHEHVDTESFPRRVALLAGLLVDL